MKRAVLKRMNKKVIKCPDADSLSTGHEGGLSQGRICSRSADFLCNSPAGVIKGAVTKTLRGDQGGTRTASCHMEGGDNDHGKSQHRLSLFLL